MTQARGYRFAVQLYAERKVRDSNAEGFEERQIVQNSARRPICDDGGKWLDGTPSRRILAEEFDHLPGQFLRLGNTVGDDPG